MLKLKNHFSKSTQGVFNFLKTMSCIHETILSQNIRQNSPLSQMILLERKASPEGRNERVDRSSPIRSHVRQFPLHQLIKEQGAETLALRHSIDLCSPLPFRHQRKDFCCPIPGKIIWFVPIGAFVRVHKLALGTKICARLLSLSLQEHVTFNKVAHRSVIAISWNFSAKESEAWLGMKIAVCYNVTKVEVDNELGELLNAMLNFSIA